MSRIKRIKEFEEFYNKKAEEIFNSFAKNDKRSALFQSLYSFYVSPGGRHGGLDENIVEIHFGNRPIDTELTRDENHRPIKKLIREAGATLFYQRTATGCVICTLYPARTESFNPPEDFILIDFLSSPSKLSRRKLKQHWNFLIAYMDVTSVEDVTSFRHRFYVWYLRTFKETFSEGKSKNKKIFVFMSTILKYTLTVSLSGSLLFLITFLTDHTNENNNQILESLKKIDQNMILLQKEQSKTNSFLEFSQKLSLQIDERIDILSDSLLNIPPELSKVNSNISELIDAGKKYIESKSYEQIRENGKSSNQPNSADAKSRAAD